MPKKKIIDIIMSKAHPKGKAKSKHKTNAVKSKTVKSKDGPKKNKTIAADKQVYVRKSAKGGKRPGAGRKKGSKESEFIKWQRKALTDYITESQVRKMISNIITKANKGSVPAQKYLLDQVFGKATNFISTPPDNPLRVLLDI